MSAIKRLVRELLELNNCPIPNISISPINEDNLNDEWHGNITSNSNSENWNGVIIHFKIEFPKEYPKFPPIVSLFSFVPHLNLQLKNGLWLVCLDMLELPPLGSNTVPYQFWTPAFSVRSILLQMTSFILSDDQPNQTYQGGQTRCINEMNQFVCNKCSHTLKNPFPSFPTLNQIINAPSSFPPIEITGESARKLQDKMFRRRCIISEINKDETKILIDKSVNNIIKENISTTIIKPITTEKWSLVGKNKISNKYDSPLLTSSSSSAPLSSISDKLKINTTLSNNSNIYELLDAQEKIECVNCMKFININDYSKSQIKKDKSICKLCIINSISIKSISSNDNVITNKNYEKRRKKRESMEKLLIETSITKINIEMKKIVNIVPTISNQQVLISQNDGSKNDENEINIDDEPPEQWKSGWGDSNQNMGSFSILSRDIVAGEICSYLSAKETLMFGVTCRGGSIVSNDWFVWKRLFHYKYPKSALSPVPKLKNLSSSFISDQQSLNQAWKHAYILESNHLSDAIRCYYSLASKNEDILGIGIEYTINPKTNELDYVTSEFDIISYNSYIKDGVRTTQWGEKFSSFLPLYIDEIHFNKTIDLLLNVAVKLVGGARNISSKSHGLLKADRNEVESSKYNKNKNKIDNDNNLWIPQSQPEMVVTLIIKMMNTIVVLLCDKGISVSEKSLCGYCQLHRLLIATIKRFPDLKIMIDKRLNNFYLHPNKRVKSFTPSIGDLFCILSVSETMSWNKISFHALLETIDRSVLWACCKDNSLINIIPGDISRINKFFDAQKLAFKLIAFHSVFLNLLIKGGGNKKLIEDCTDRYDLFSGRPPLYIQNEFRNYVEKILEMSNFNMFFNVSCIAVPTSTQLLNTLEKAVSNSFKKGYHDDNTRFDKIHKSGVSKILLKGESYSADPNIKTIQLVERWKFDGELIFLDASCLIYNFSGQNINTVDYINTSWGKNCIIHSGDIINDGIGEHTITIHVKKIPSHVQALYFTVSAWTTTLNTIRQPSCHLHDYINDVELCNYSLEDKNTGANTSVIMCKFHRQKVGDKWQMTTIGHIGMGRAGNYYPINQSINNGL